MRHSIVILDRDPTTVGILQFILRDAGYQVSATANGAEATGMVQLSPPDLVLLDPDLRPVDGLRLLADWRANGFNGACIVVSSRATLDDQLQAFELGVDDFVTKPFEPVILVARIRSVLRRLQAQTVAQSSAIVTVGDAELSLSTLTFRRDDSGTVSVTPTEARFLEFLMRRAGNAVSRAELELHVWGDTHDGDTNRVEVYIRRLRQKIEHDPTQPRFIRTLRASGYVFDDGSETGINAENGFGRRLG